MGAGSGHDRVRRGYDAVARDYVEHFGDDPFGERSDEFEMAAQRDPSEALSTCRAEIERSRAIVGGADSLDDCGQSGLSLRFWLVKTLNEYGRHNGHADLLRELIDGTTGE